MQINARINYNGHTAGYKITSGDLSFYHAELTDFTGVQADTPPSQIHFIKANQSAIASSDIIDIARDLVKQIRL